MNADETARILSLIEGSYPTFKVNDARITAWMEFFANWPALVVATVVGQWCANEHWPPSVADILGPLNRRALGWPEVDEAQTQVYMAMRAVGRGHKSDMHPAVRRIVKELGGIKTMAEGGKSDPVGRLFTARYMAEYQRALAEHATAPAVTGGVRPGIQHLAPPQRQLAQPRLDDSFDRCLSGRRPERR